MQEAPKNDYSYTIRCIGFTIADEYKDTFFTEVTKIVTEVSGACDLTSLSAITFAYDYANTLLNLERGFKATEPLIATNDIAVGAAMSVTIIDNGIYKKHIVISWEAAKGLISDTKDEYEMSKYFLIHELCHVSEFAIFNSCFPNHVLFTAKDIQDAVRWSAINDCWKEYSACYISNYFIQYPEEYYEDNFIEYIEAIDARLKIAFECYIETPNLDEIISKVYSDCTALMKYASYHLGNINGRAKQSDACLKSMNKLANHWFLSFYVRLSEILNEIMESFGCWDDLSAFEAIGDLVEDIVKSRGLFLRRLDNGSIWCDVYC